MATVEEQIRSAATTISENITELAGNRKLMSKNIIKQLRDLTEGVIVRAHTGSATATYDQRAIEAGTGWVGSSDRRFSFLHRFHKLLQQSESHYAFDGDISERLMLKYFATLLRIRELLRTEFGMELMANLEDFPVDLDPSLTEYHERIAERIEAAALLPPNAGADDHYYVQSVRPLVTGTRVLYEVTFTNITDNPSKFDRVIAFTDIDMSARYAANLLLMNDEIEVFGRRMPITIVRGWTVAIRPCELLHLAEIFGMETSSSRTVEYNALMQFLTDTGSSLLDLMDMSPRQYEYVKARATSSSKTPRIFPVLDKARELLSSGAPGTNIVRYLMLDMNNRIIKLQQDHRPYRHLSGLRLTARARPFDTMPFAANPAGHVTRLADLIESLKVDGREHELLARRLKTNVEQLGMLYTSEDELAGFDNLEDLIEHHNRTIPPIPTHVGRTIERDKDHLFIRQYEDETVEIIERLQSLTGSGINGHEQAVERWFAETTLKVDDPAKSSALRALFSASKVAFIYGAAGTGKSTMVNLIANYLGDQTKLFLAHTNPAKANLERKVAAQNVEFSTIASHLAKGVRRRVDVLVIDECSIVSNADMLKVLDTTDFKLLVLVGDVFQIEAIQFGNWFDIAPGFLPKKAVFQLTKAWRTDDESLLDFWTKVRNLEDGIEEAIAHQGYASPLDGTLFEREVDDEIILCLNYDGLYGINNINRFLQAGNPGKAVTWGANIYKVDDPIVFGNTGRFHPLIHNNLKGKIADVELTKEGIAFTVWLERNLSELSVWNYAGLEYVADSTVRFEVSRPKSTDADSESNDSIVPFQVAYAASIHRSQGLEYESVKIVITDANEDDISHGIFYTAITRAREKLKIYWTAETQNAVLSQLKPRQNGRDVGLLKARRSLKRV